MSNDKARLSESGESLVSTMVALGVMSIVMLGFTTMMTTQSKNTQALNEKLAAQEVQRMLTSSMNDSTCEHMLTHASNPAGRSSRTFNSGDPNAEITFQSILASNVAGVAPIATVNGTPSAMAKGLVVQKIALRNFNGGSDQYSADFQITFDVDKSVRPVKDIIRRVYVQTDPASPAGSKLLAGCTLANETPTPGLRGIQVLSGAPYNTSRAWAVPNDVTSIRVTVIGAGGSGGSGGGNPWRTGTCNGGGGGAGAVVIGLLTDIPKGTIFTYAIGAPGASRPFADYYTGPCSNGYCPGFVGSATSFNPPPSLGAALNAGGGGRGAAGCSSNQENIVFGAPGGTVPGGSGGQIKMPGQASATTSQYGSICGTGASTLYGAGGGGCNNGNLNDSGFPGSGYGAGGGGSTGNRASGAGAPGAIILEY